MTSRNAKRSGPDQWMPFYGPDFLADTGNLNAAEIGAYVLFLLHAWRHNGLIPADYADLAQLSRMTPVQWEKSRDRLLEFWEEVPGGLTQHRLARELAAAKAIHAAKVSGGRSGGEANRKQNGSIASTLPQAEQVAKEKVKDTHTHIQEPTPSLRSGAATAASLTKEQVWKVGKEMLASQGVGPNTAGSYLGSIIKLHGEDQVLVALMRAIDERPADLRGWLKGCLRPKVVTGAKAAAAAVTDEIWKGHHERSGERDISADSQRVA